MFNALMVIVLIASIVAGYQYFNDKHSDDAPIYAFVAIVCGSIFSAYSMVLGISTSLTELFDYLRHGVIFLTTFLRTSVL